MRVGGVLQFCARLLAAQAMVACSFAATAAALPLHAALIAPTPDTPLAAVFFASVWSTWWFRVAAGAALLGCIYTFIRWRGAARQRARLAAEVKVRTAEVLQQKEAVERSLGTLSVLGEIGREITAVLDEDEVCRTLDRHVNELLDATTFVVYRIDADGQGLTSALRMEERQALPVAHIPLDSPTRYAARCARERRELLLDKAPGAPNPSHVPGTHFTLTSLFAPLLIGERLIGVMTVQSLRQHAYGERELLVFRTLCAYGAIALDNAAAYRRLAEADAEVQRVLRQQQAHLEQEVQARTAEVVQQKEDLERSHDTLAVLGEIGRQITTELEVSAVCRTLNRHVQDLLDAESFVIYLLDPDGRSMTSVLFVEQGQNVPADTIALASPTRHGARCARERMELLVDTDPAQNNPSQVPGTLVTLSALFSPLTSGERLLGVMTIQSSKRHAYGEREQLVFRTLCAYGAIALDNAAAYRRLAEADAEVQRVLREQQGLLEQEVRARTAEVEQQKANLEQAHDTLSVLGEIGRQITAELEVLAVCQTLNRHVQDLLDAQAFTMFLLDPGGLSMTEVLSVELGQDSPPMTVDLADPAGYSARCVRERRELLVEFSPDEEIPTHVPGSIVTLSALFAPLLIGERVLGAMTIQSPREHAYGERERLVFRTLCAYGAIALDNAAAYRRLAEADAEIQRVLREQQAKLEQEVRARTTEVIQQKEDLERSHDTLAVLGKIGRQITAELEVSAVCQTLNRHVQRLLDMESFTIYLLDPDGQRMTSVLFVELGQDAPAQTVELSNPVSHGARCIRERRELLVEFAPNQENPTHVPGSIVTLSALFAPLMVGERVLGVMTIQSPREHAYGERERLVFRTLCAYGAIALDNAIAYHRLADADALLQEALREQELIYDNAAAAIFLVKGRTIHRCNRTMEELLGWEPGELVGQSTAVYHLNHEAWTAEGQRVEPTLRTGKVAEGEWEVVRKDGRHLWLSYRGRALEPPEVEKGSIWVASDITARKHAETALVDAKQKLERGLAEVEQLNRQITLLGELTGFLQACPSVTEACACICRFGPRLFADSAGSLYLCEGQGPQWVEQGHWNDGKADVPASAHTFLADECWALRRSRPYRVDSVVGALCCAHRVARHDHGHPYACLPLMAQGKTFGLLYVEHHGLHDAEEADRRFSLATAMAEQIALAIANVQLREALLQQSIRDPLTSLYNRRHMQEALQREVARAERSGDCFAVLMIDVDHFKKFNDTFGHPAGDLVLQQVAHTIQSRVRRSDVACRFGGEEFTVLLTGATREQAEHLANELLEGVRQLRLAHDDQPLDGVTASLGVALFPRHGNLPEELIAAADSALYRAKQAGRNRIVVSNDNEA